MNRHKYVLVFVLVVVIPSGSVHSQLDVVAPLLLAAENANGLDELARILAQVQKLPQHTLHDFIHSACKRAPNARMIGALALGGVRDTDELKRFFPVLSMDKKLAVRRAAWLTVNLSQVGTDQYEITQRSRDSIIRAIYVLRNHEKSVVAKFCRDPCPFVRTVAIRRLLKLGCKEDASVVSALATCLVDHHQLVRSNAILLAQTIRRIPSTSIGLSLVTDDRPLILLEDVFSDDKESPMLRKRLGLPAEVDLSLALFHVLLIDDTAPVFSIQDTGPLTPPDEDQLIGPLSAHLCVLLKLDGAHQTLRNAIECQWNSSSTMARQLRAVETQ